MKHQSKEHTPRRKTRTWNNARAYCYLSCDIFNRDNHALGYVEVDEYGLDIYSKGARTVSKRIDWREAIQRLLAVVMIAVTLSSCAGPMTPRQELAYYNRNAASYDERNYTPEMMAARRIEQAERRMRVAAAINAMNANMQASRPVFVPQPQPIYVPQMPQLPTAFGTYPGSANSPIHVEVAPVRSGMFAQPTGNFWP